jgi:hypothetical protein
MVMELSVCALARPALNSSVEPANTAVANRLAADGLNADGLNADGLNPNDVEKMRVCCMAVSPAFIFGVARS